MRVDCGDEDEDDDERKLARCALDADRYQRFITSWSLVSELDPETRYWIAMIRLQAVLKEGEGKAYFTGMIVAVEW
jgi:hypothetical protein